MWTKGKDGSWKINIIPYVRCVRLEWLTSIISYGSLSRELSPPPYRTLYSSYSALKLTLRYYSVARQCGRFLAHFVLSFWPYYNRFIHHFYGTGPSREQ